MKFTWRIQAQVLIGIFAATTSARPQAGIISAKPGGINYVEGQAFIDGNRISERALRTTFLGANDSLSTRLGKAEILLTPGVFLRLANESEIRMISPSLTDTQVEVVHGEAMLEVDQLLKDNHISVADHGGLITVRKAGLYRLTADNEPTAAVLEGKAEVRFGSEKIEIGKGRETVLGEGLTTQKFNKKQEDELYAWSNVRSEYNAAATYQAAKSVNTSDYSYLGLGAGLVASPGWYWANSLNSWAWLPGNNGFFSPFGWGFYGPGALGYAPVVMAPVYRTGTWVPGANGQPGHFAPSSGTTNGFVPVNVNRVPAVGNFSASPAAYHSAQVATASSMVNANPSMATHSGGAWHGGAANSGTHSAAGSNMVGHAGGGASGGGHR